MVENRNKKILFHLNCEFEIDFETEVEISSDELVEKASILLDRFFPEGFLSEKLSYGYSLKGITWDIISPVDPEKKRKFKRKRRSFRLKIADFFWEMGMRLREKRKKCWCCGKEAYAEKLDVSSGDFEKYLRFYCLQCYLIYRIVNREDSFEILKKNR